MRQEKVGNPSDQNSDKLPLYKRAGIGILAVGVATGSALGLTGCYPTSAQGNETTPTASAPETPGVEPTSEPSETQAPTETATPTETESPSPEVNPFITERFKELDAMTLKEFEEQPREDRAAYMTAFMYKFSDPEWQSAVASEDEPTLGDYNIVLNAPTTEDSDIDIAYQQFLKERVAGEVESSDANVKDYGRERSLQTGQKLAAAQFYFSPSEMNQTTKYVYQEQLKRVQESYDSHDYSINGAITVGEKEDVNFSKEVDGKEQTIRIVGMRVDHNEESWAASLEFVYVTDTIDGKALSQWMISDGILIPSNDIPLAK